MQNCKSIVTMVFECYFSNQLLHCIGMACIEMIMSVLQEVKVNKKNVFHTSTRKTSFHIKFQAQWFTCFDIGTACIIMYCQD